ncbi:fibronectin type III domain-containing protein [Bacillus paranthracis]|uniref:Fibronectin type III domain-containing protein n=1 Tax=Bacillus paranthracis TaxID=2026186 RepID=A0AAX3QKI7_9BACI|nr:fibronectin type III domain-containing protein [Bacillus paranthracis]WES09757.1 fibronectin type III domain-containing protein [Bacillus paranthracis]
MRFKKCFAVFSIMMIMCLSVLPSFASAEEIANENLMSGLPIVEGGSLSYYQATDGDEKTSMTIRASREYIVKLKKPLKGDSTYTLKGKFNRGFVTDLNLPKRDIFYYKLYSGNSQLEVKNIPLSTRNGSFVFKTGAYPKSIDTIGIAVSDLALELSLIDLYLYEGDISLMRDDVSDLNAIEGINDVSFSWKNPVSSDFTGVKIFRDNTLVADVGKEVESYKVKDLEGNKNYNFKFVAMYGKDMSNGVQKGVKTLVDPKTIPPGPVYSLTAEPTDKTVKLKWKKPKDDDLAGFKILQNGKQVAEIGLEEEFTVKNLQPLTDYTFGVISVDRDKNDSPPVSLSVKTLEENDEEPPHVPSNVFAKPSNGALIASWDKVSDKDLAGYNLYVDGKKINSNLITSTNFVIKNLENSKKYKIQVQAVDRSGNASELSLAAFGTPDVNTIPVIESNYGVKDVSDGVGTMFSQIWPALAFSVGIVLAFYVIYKLKHTILP